MGCNTSKESNVTNVDEKDDIRIASDEQQPELRGDANCNQEKLPQLPQALSNEKIKEAQTTAKRNSTETDKSSNITNKERSGDLEKVDGESEGLEEAATKIQAVFRGHQTRKTMKQGDKPEKNSENTEDLANEFKPDDPELSNAATKIQASFRGHMARKKIAGKDNGEHEEQAQGDLNKKPEDEEDFDIDLADPELNKAATKIQATFRTHMKHKDE